MRKELLIATVVVLACFAGSTALAAADLPSAEDALAQHDLREALAQVEAGYSSPWSVTFADFVPMSPASDDCLFAGDPGSEAFVSASDNGVTCCIVAPVHLPDGATVTSIFFYLYDESSADLTMSLRRKRITNTLASTVMGTASTSGSGTSMRILPDISIADPVVDNATYSYFVSSDTCLDRYFDLRYYQALVFYSE